MVETAAAAALAVLSGLLPPTDMDSVNNRLSCAFQSKLEFSPAPDPPDSHYMRLEALLLEYLMFGSVCTGDTIGNTSLGEPLDICRSGVSQARPPSAWVTTSTDSRDPSTRS